MKNKKIVFAIILFLLIGFTIFTFANPSKDEKTFEDNNSKTEDKVDTNKDKNKDSINTDNSDSLNTDENKTDATTNDNGTNSVRNRSNTNIQSNATSTVIVEQSDDKYAKALDAVVKAEGSLSQDDLNTAKDLVGDLDEGEDRNKLQDRIDDVQDIIDVEGLVSTLESKKTSAQNKDEMLSAREYNTSQKIEDAVKNLKDSEAKNNLKKRLDSALKVVNDVNPAEVDGIDEKYTNADSVTLTITDENGYTATLNGDPYESGKEITDEGHYTLKVVDEAFNESEVEFIIDRTSPVVNMSDGKTYEGDEYTYYNSSVTPEIVEENIDTVVLTKDGATVDGYTNGEITDEGKYELTVTDKVGNSVTVKFVIDKTEGTVTFDNNGSDSNSYNNVTVTATINEKYLDKVEYLITPSHTLDDVKKMEFTEAEISEDNTIKITLSELNGTYNIWVKVTDKAGNVSYTKPNNGFKMDNIAPTATVTFDPAGPTNQSVTATIEVSEPIQTPDWWTKIDEEGKKFTKTYDKNGWDTVKIVDLAGNEGSIDVNVTNIDTDDPDLNSIKLYNVTKNLTKEQKHYIKKDQEIMFEVKANEKLVTNDFKVTIGNSTSKFTYSEGSDYYWAKVKINDETSIEEGEVKFTISGYKDLAGNIGTTYGNYETENVTLFDDIKDKNFNSVIYDKTSPEITFYGIDENNILTGDKRIYIKDANPAFTGTIVNKDNNNQLREIKSDAASYNKYYKLYETAFKMNYNSMYDGSYKITITDIAGNETVKEFVMDNTKPVANYVEIKNLDQYTPGYAKTGDRIWVYATINEKLSVEPTITINGKTAKIMQREVNGNSYKYVGEVVLDESMDEGEVKFTIDGYKDLAGNEGAKLDNSNITDKEGNLKSVTYIKTPAVLKASFINSNGNKVGNEYYAIKGSKITTYMSVNQKLAHMPTITLVDVEGNEVSYGKDKIEDEYGKIIEVDEMSKNGIYRYQLTYTITDDTPLKDGRINVKFSDIYNLAGYKGINWIKEDGKHYEELGIDDRTNMSVNVTLDTKNPENISGSLGLVSHNGNVLNKDGKRYYYATDKDTIYVYAQFDETLSVNPKFTITGETSGEYTGDMKYVEGQSRYVGTVNVKDIDNLSDGLINIKVNGYKDVAGNEGIELTNDNLRASWAGVIIDTTAPSLIVDGIEYTPDTKGTIHAITPDGDGSATFSGVDKLSGYAGIWGHDVNKQPELQNSYRRGAGHTYSIKAEDILGNTHTYSVKVIDSSSSESISDDLNNLIDGESINLSNKDITDNVEIKANNVTITGNSKSTISGGLKISGNGVTIKDVTIDGITHNTHNGLTITGDNVTLENLTANNDFPAINVSGNNLTIDGGNYSLYNSDVPGEINGRQGEGVIRVTNSCNVNIHNATLHGGIALINFCGEADIADNNIILDYNGTAALVGINITTDNQGNYTAQSLYNANKFDIQNFDYSYYVKIQRIDWSDIDSIKISDLKTISTPEALRDISTNPSSYKGKRIVLDDDIDLTGQNWTPIDGWGNLSGTTIDGNGHSIKNMTVEADSSGGFIGNLNSAITIKNIVFENANVKTKKSTTKDDRSYAGVVIAKSYSKNTILENVTVKNSRVENDWQSGGLVGFSETNGATFINCTIEDSYIGGYNEPYQANSTAGILFGAGDASNITVTGCTAKNVQLETDNTDETHWVGYTYGKEVKVSDSTEENITIIDRSKNTSPAVNNSLPELESSDADEAQENTESSQTEVVKYNIDFKTQDFPYASQPFSLVKSGTTYTEKEITITSENDKDYQEYLSKNNYKPENVIWWTQFNCDMDKCEGFNESGTDNKKATIFEGRRGDASITMEAPTAKDGYEFDKWEESTIEYNGIKMQSFTAIYKEKDTQKEESAIQTLIDSMITTTTTLFKNI